MSALNPNYFASGTAAAHYRLGRPDFHLEVIARIRRFMAPDGLIDRALDVACGTGLSTKALLDIARRIDGTDCSAEMLAMADAHPRISYQQAPAEDQPFSDRMFDLITVCSGVHWFRIDVFLAECRRLLRPDGLLVLYDNYFSGHCAECPELRNWYREVYLEKFPPPKRHDNYDWINEKRPEKGLQFLEEEHFSNAIVFDRGSLIRYFITQSNIIRPVIEGQMDYEEAQLWLDAELKRFFPDQHISRQIQFDNWIKYLKQFPAQIP